jgi:hypothetical protein
LAGVEQTATLAVKSLSEVLTLKTEIEKEIHLNFGRRANSALLLLHSLFKDPVTTIDKAAKTCRLSYKAANDLVTMFQEKKFLREMTGQSRNRIFIFESYLNAFESD